MSVCQLNSFLLTKDGFISSNLKKSSFRSSDKCGFKHEKVKILASLGGGGIIGRLGRVLKEKASSDIQRIFKGVTKTRENLSIVDEILTFWNLNESETVLEELEETLIVSDFGPRTSLKIVDNIREEILAGKLKTADDIKKSLKANIVSLLTQKVITTELLLPSKAPAVIMIVGVNGSGKTTTLGKLAHKFREEGSSVLMAAGDTFRAAAVDQLKVWAERTGSDFVTADTPKMGAGTVLMNGVQQGLEKNVDIVLADTSGRLHTNERLMTELRNCKKAINKALPGAPHEILLVLDGTTGLNMLIQAKEFNQLLDVTGIVLTKLDGTSRGGCVVSVVDELGIPVKFVGVGESLDDLQPFDPVAYVDALFPS